MSTQFHVDTAALSGSSSDIARISADIDSSVSAMMARLTAMQSNWQGAAASNFQELITRWQGVQAQVRDSLTDIGQVLGNASQQYAEAEAANAAMFRR